MLDIMKAIYELMGRFSEPIVDDNTAKRHAEMVFQVRFNDEYVLNIIPFVAECCDTVQN